jgi:hypothetical protein
LASAAFRRDTKEAEMANEKRSAQVQRIIQAIESVLNAEIPGTPRISQVRRTSAGLTGRVMYVALPGSGRKSKNVLSRRAQQVLATINRLRKATSAAIQEALEVNRNVIAGAVHELKQAKFVKAVPVGPAMEVVGEFHPRAHRKTTSNDRAPRKSRKSSR